MSFLGWVFQRILIIRTGIGILYKWLETSALFQVKSNNIDSSEILIASPGFPNPFVNGTPILPQVTKSIRQLSSEIKNPRRFYSIFAPAYSFNQSTKVSFALGYSRTNNDFISLDENSAKNGVRVNPNLGRIIQTESTALTIERFAVIGFNTQYKSIPVEASYLFNQITNETDGIFSLPVDNNNPKADLAISGSFPQHTFNLSTEGSLGQLIRKSTFNSVNLSLNFKASSGLPYSLTTGIDNNGDLEINDRPLGIKRNTLQGSWTFVSNTSFVHVQCQTQSG